MKIGMTIEPFKGVTIPKLLSLMRLLELDHLEINFTMLDSLEEFIAHKKRFTTTFHSPIYSRNHFDFSTSNPQREKEIHWIINRLNCFKNELDLRYVLVHPPEDPQANIELYLERIKQIDSPILLENVIGMKEHQFMDYFYNLKDTLQRNFAGIAFDGPHQFVNNSEKWLDLPSDFKNNIAYIHVSDCTKTKDLHLPLGMGEFPIKQLFDFLEIINFQGIILNEILPNGLSVHEVMESFLICAKNISLRRYHWLKTKYSVIEPFIQMQINKALKNVDRNSLQSFISELGCDVIMN